LPRRRFPGFAHEFFDFTDRPHPTVDTLPRTRIVIEHDGLPMKPRADKPPYRIPSMAEIAAIEPNGLIAASTFSGCGGSSLGYRMAGYRVAYANEFVAAARDSYRANAAPGTILDGRDIRSVSAADILRRIGLDVGELDLLDGSPPCSSFSTAGKRHEGWGKQSAYSDTAQRTDDLFFEFVRIVRDAQPRAFVAENVSGLVKGTGKGYFLEVLSSMKAAGYRVEARLLDAQWLGVPQARERLIFVGVRNDLGLAPAHPKPLPYRYSVRDALPWINRQGDNAGFGGGTLRFAGGPSPTIGSSPQTGNGRFPPSLVEAEADISRYAIGREWDKLLPGEATFYGASLAKPALDRPSPTITQRGGDNTAASVCHPTEKRKFSIAELRRICGFPDDFILTGTYAQQWERLGRAVPPPMMRAIAETIRDRVLIPARSRAAAA
jgi:DNA (cytosine-5)-methyltransferase 1